MKSRPLLSRRQHGFTMIEVLVALVIVAVALAASVRAVGSMANNAHALHLRMLADWSADSALARLRLERHWPAVGTTRFACPQGDVELTCVEQVSNTPNPTFRRVEINVLSADGHDTRLAQLVTVLANESQRSL
jgi:general secretion pathway protein I